jgi:hypothetical protein
LFGKRGEIIVYTSKQGFAKFLHGWKLKWIYIGQGVLKGSSPQGSPSPVGKIICVLEYMALQKIFADVVKETGVRCFSDNGPQIPAGSMPFHLSIWGV